MSPTLLIFTLALLAMVGPLGIDTYLPSFPAIAHEFSAAPALVQQTLSLYVLAMAAMMLVYGTLSDSFGRRPVILVSLGLFAAANLGAVFAPSVGALMVWRILQGLACGAGTVVGRAVLQDYFKGADAARAAATITMVFGLAPALAPVLGGWLQAGLGWRWIFVFLTAFSLGLWLLCYRLLPETLPHARRTAFAPHVVAANYARCLRHSSFMLMSLAIAFLFSVIAIYVGSAAAVVMGILHQPETAFAWLFVPMISGMVGGSAIASRWAHRVAATRMVGVGFTTMTVAALLNVGYNAMFTPQLPYAVVPIFLYTFGMALAMPSLSVRTLRWFPDMSGMAASMQGFIQMFVFALVSGLVAPLLFGSGLHLALGLAAGVGLGMLLWRWATRSST